jgi:hypothetical protein
MSIRTSFIHEDKRYTVSIRTVALPWLFDRMSVIVEVRDLSGGIIQVWHYHITHEGKIIHKDRKYP